MGRKWALSLVFVLISSMLLFSVPVRSVTAEPITVYVDPPTVVDPAGFFNVSVKLDNVQGLVGAEFKLYWDPVLLHGVNMTDVIFHEVTPESEWDNIWRLYHEINNVEGFSWYAYSFVRIRTAEDGGYAPISGNFTVFVMLFQVMGMGNCTLHFAKSNLGNDDAAPIAHDTVDGFFSNSILPPSVPPSPSGDAQVLLYTEPRGVKNESLVVNSTFSIAVRLASVADHSGIVLVGFTLEWNATLLECVNVTEVIFHGVMPQDRWENINWYAIADNDEGWLFFVTGFSNLGDIASYGPLLGNYTVAVLTFRVVDVGKCQLYLHRCVVYAESDEFLLYNAFSGVFANKMNADLNGDSVVDLYDALVLASSFGARPQTLNWVEDADINGDGIVDIFDAITLCGSFGHTR